MDFLLWKQTTIHMKTGSALNVTNLSVIWEQLLCLSGMNPAFEKGSIRQSAQFPENNFLFFSDSTLGCLLLGKAVVLFSFDLLEAETVALGRMLSFVICSVLTSGQAFSGFTSDTVMMIMGLLIMTAALTQNGAMEGISRWVRAMFDQHSCLGNLGKLPSPA